MAQFTIDELDIKDIPTDTGVYLFKDINNTILYVGKARSLRKRLTSYLRPKETLPIKTQSMLSHATSIYTIHTTTEKEALLLEASLIKKHKPKYNIVLRDDKQHIVFCIRKGVEYPRVEIHHRTGIKNALYFGPFTSASGAKATWKVLHSIFPLRRCTDKTLNNRTTPCLYYHIEQCLAPCVFDVSKEEYEGYLYKVILFLRGKTDNLIKGLMLEMEKASENLEFEKAILLREQIYAIQRTIEKQAVVLEKNSNVDVLGVVEIEKGIALAVVFIREGRVIDSLQFYFPSLTIEDANELLYSFISQYYTDGKYIPSCIMLPHIGEEYKELYPVLEEVLNNKAYEQADYSDEISQQENIFTKFHPSRKIQLESKVHITKAQTPTEYKLIDIALSNARNIQITKEHVSLAQSIATSIGSTKPIIRIEAVDVSHTSGANTRVGVVVFEEGEQKPVDYRTYNIEDAHGDDYKALHTWIARRIIDVDFPYPDMLLIDGGKGQLSVIERSIIEILGELPFPLVAITKARKEDGTSDRRAGNVSDRLFIPNRSNPLSLASGSRELLYLQKIRDTVHDYALGRHRKAHTNSMLTSELHRIKGIGEKTITILLERFGSVRGIATASIEELSTIKGISKQKALDIHQHLHKFITKG